MPTPKTKNKITKTPTKDSPKKESLVVKGSEDDNIKKRLESGCKLEYTKEVELDLVGNKANPEIKEKKLNVKQEFFCKLYATDRSFFGNGALSYAEAYDVDLTTKGGYHHAQVNSNKLLSNTVILKRINEYLDTEGFNAENVDRQHLFLINQDADLKVKMSAIKEFNALKKRVDNSLTLNIKDLLSKYGSDDDD